MTAGRLLKYEDKAVIRLIDHDIMIDDGGGWQKPKRGSAIYSKIAILRTTSGEGVIIGGPLSIAEGMNSRSELQLVI